MKPLTNVAEERAVLSGLAQYGHSCYIDVSDLLDEDCFTSSMNKIIYQCIAKSFHGEPSVKIDVASIYSTATNLGFIELLTEESYSNYITSLFNFHIEQENIRKFAIKIRKLSIARKLRETLSGIQNKLLEVDGSESISNIISIAETDIFSFTSNLNNQDNDPQLIGHGLEQIILDRINNPVDQVGIPTGFNRWDQAIGGGLRPGTVNLIGARIKVGKSLLGANMGYHIANNLGIPVLNMDTEMTKEDQQNRTLAMMTECFFHDIETGKFIKKPGQEKRVLEAAIRLEQEKIPYYHKSISGTPFEEQLSIIRRWIVKEVGLNSNGHAKPCVVVYDYVKLMTGEGISSNMSEFQILGFMVTKLQELALKYNFPILAFTQLNRDGISGEDSDAIAGSDRLAWFCSNFSIFKYKSDEERAADGEDAGNRKLVPVFCRHGAGLQPGDYINCYARGEIAKIKEGFTTFELSQSKQAE